MLRSWCIEIDKGLKKIGVINLKKVEILPLNLGKSVCLPKALEGLGFCDMAELNSALVAKLA